MSASYQMGGYKKGFRDASPIVGLLPMTLADLLDEASNQFRGNWKTIGTAALLFSAPIAITSVVLYGALDFLETSTTASEATLAAGGIASILLLGFQLIYYMLVFPLLSAAVTKVSTAACFGQECQLKEAFLAAVRLWPKLIVISLITSVGASVVMSVLGLVFFLVSIFLAALWWPLVIPAAIVFVPAFIAAAVFSWAIFALSTPNLVVENRGIFDALARSWKLVRARFWFYLGALTLVAVIAVFAGFIAQAPLLIIAELANIFEIPYVAWFANAGADLTGNLITQPFLIVGIVFVYFDARIRSEALDLQLMAARLPDENGIRS